ALNRAWAPPRGGACTGRTWRHVLTPKWRHSFVVSLFKIYDLQIVISVLQLLFFNVPSVAH
ncbi:MAG: hypothetical protein ACRBBJ_12435, partial [Rhodomicrobiaceae bacterium]